LLSLFKTRALDHIRSVLIKLLATAACIAPAAYRLGAIGLPVVVACLALVLAMFGMAVRDGIRLRRQMLGRQSIEEPVEAAFA
jgi:hypothetical protein